MMSKLYSPESAASGVEQVIQLLEGRWKLIILFICSTAKYSAIQILKN